MAGTALGTDGLGRSDMRANLRRYYEVDRYYVAQAAVDALAKKGKMTAKDASRAINLYETDVEKTSVRRRASHCICVI
jgi:pyruvate dehydrogenase E1 component